MHRIKSQRTPVNVDILNDQVIEEIKYITQMKKRLYPQSWIHTLLYTKATINKTTLYADSSTYMSTTYCAAFHLFSAQLALDFSVVRYSSINREQHHHKKGTKFLSTGSIMSPASFWLLHPMHKKHSKFHPLPSSCLSKFFSAPSDLHGKDSFLREREVQTIPKQKETQLSSLCLLLMHNISKTSVRSWGRILCSLCIPVGITKDTPSIRLHFILIPILVHFYCLLKFTQSGF